MARKTLGCRILHGLVNPESREELTRKCDAREFKIRAGNFECFCAPYFRISTLLT